MKPDQTHASQRLWAKYIKRPVDAVAAGLLIILTSPVLALAAVLVKCTSRGPVFFTQPRAGRFGRPFPIYKFRTMTVHHEHDPTETITLAHPGITPVGRVLRRTKIDELPQIFSVLLGTMSLIGPRPGLVSQAEAYNTTQQRRLLMRPGCTGLAQVNCENTGADWTERILYDVYYVKHCSFWLDLSILVKTPLVILLGEKRFARPFEDTPYAGRQ
jgi:putative colanic acid biosynthesis UDP-glucose lipid carrier transferase